MGDDVAMEDVEEKKPVVNENVEYVTEQLEGAALEAFSDVFARFQAHAQSSVVRSPSYCYTIIYNGYRAGAG